MEKPTEDLIELYMEPSAAVEAGGALASKRWKGQPRALLSKILMHREDEAAVSFCCEHIDGYESGNLRQLEGHRALLSSSRTVGGVATGATNLAMTGALTGAEMFGGGLKSIAKFSKKTIEAANSAKSGLEAELDGALDAAGERENGKDPSETATKKWGKVKGALGAARRGFQSVGGGDSEAEADIEKAAAAAMAKVGKRRFGGFRMG